MSDITAACHNTSGEGQSNSSTASTAVVTAATSISGISPTNTDTSIFEPIPKSNQNPARDTIQLKEALSVGIVSIALFFVTFLCCMLLKRRKEVQNHRAQLFRSRYIDDKSTESLMSVLAGDTK